LSRQIAEKIKPLKALKKEIGRFKKSGKIIVFTNGCFDVLHYGHVKYLEEAKKTGDVLIVAVNSDSSVKRIKGSKRPLVQALDRARLIAALESVDLVTIFTQDTPLETIREVKPDVLIKGADWDKSRIAGSSIVSSYGGKIKTIKLVSGRSTSKLIKKIAQRF